MALFGKKKEEAPPMGMPSYPEQGYEDYGQGAQYPPEAYPEEQYPPGAEQAAYPQAPPPAPELDKEAIEEIAEAIVEEKWAEKKRDIDKVMEWKDEVTIKLTQLQQQIDDLKSSFDGLHKGLLGKISEYDENLTNVGTEIKAMEKVFSRVLPSLTDSVNKLQRISDTSVKKK